MKILVTGSSGMIGTRLCEALIEQGHEVLGADIKDNQWNSDIQNFTTKIDLRNSISTDIFPTDIDMIVHLAANARVNKLVLQPELAKDNFNMTFNILEYTRKNNIKRFIFSSSKETYGNCDDVIQSEKDPRISYCEGPYTASKIAGEALIHSYQKCYGIDFMIFRLSNVYGKYDLSDRIVPALIKQCLKGESLTLYGKEKILDFTYIDDAVDGIISGIDAFDSTKNETFNLASGVGLNIAEIAKRIRDLTGSDSDIIIKASRCGEVVKFIGNIAKAKEYISYTPSTDIHTGLRNSIEWIRSNTNN